MPVLDKIKYLANRVFGPDPIDLPPYELRGVPGNVQRLMEDGVKEGSKKIFRGIVGSIATGAGKGAVVVAVLAVAASALNTGASVGFTIFSLFSGAGAVILAAGALLGAVMEIHQNQKFITAEVAKIQAKQFEILREKNQEMRDEAKTANVVEYDFAAREQARRAMAQQSLGK